MDGWQRHSTPYWPTDRTCSQRTNTSPRLGLSTYLEGMNRTEIERATRAILMDVLEQCARHMDAIPMRRALFKPVAYAVHAALEDFDRQFNDGVREDEGAQRRLFARAQDMAMEWLHTMQELRSEYPLYTQLESLPSWTMAPRPASGQIGKALG